MNTTTKCLLTGVVSWGAALTVPLLVVNKGLLWSLSYILPSFLIGPALLLVVSLLLALAAALIVRIWKKPSK
jgi:cobalamin biosynthesis protein CobD/CbiB